MTNEKCLVELDEVLKYLVIEDLNKIPVEIRNFITQQKDKNYIWKYDETKSLGEQKLNRRTIAMLSYLNMEYIQTEEQKLLMEKYHKLNEQTMKQKERVKYDSMFNKENKEVEENIKNDNQLIKVSTEKWYKKLFNSIKNIFKK